MKNQFKVKLNVRKKSFNGHFFLFSQLTFPELCMSFNVDDKKNEEIKFSDINSFCDEF